MRKFLKSRFFVVTAIITLILVTIPTVLSTFGLQNHLRGMVNVLMTPLQKGFNYVTDAMDGFTSYFSEFDELVAEPKPSSRITPVFAGSAFIVPVLRQFSITPLYCI